MAHHVTGGRGISIVVFDAPSSLHQYMVEKFREISSAAAAERGFCTVALSGGQTPVGFYSEAAAAEGIDWSRIHIFQIDERFVPPSDSRSNFGMIGNTLIDPAAVPRENVHPMPVRGADADASRSNTPERSAPSLLPVPALRPKRCPGSTWSCWGWAKTVTRRLSSLPPARWRRGNSLRVPYLWKASGSSALP